MKIDFDAVILAAGSSERMGRPKLSLALDNGISFAEQCARLYAGFGCRRIVMVVNQDGMDWLEMKGQKIPPEVVAVLNQYVLKGKLFSLQCGLRALDDAEKSVFVHNVDNPFITRGILSWLVSFAGRADCIRPYCAGQYGSPVLISPQAARKLMMAGEYGIPLREHLHRSDCIFAETERPEVLANINTPADYMRYISCAGSKDA